MSSRNLAVSKVRRSAGEQHDRRPWRVQDVYKVTIRPRTLLSALWEFVAIRVEGDTRRYTWTSNVTCRHSRMSRTPAVDGHVRSGVHALQNCSISVSKINLGTAGIMTVRRYISQVRIVRHWKFDKGNYILIFKALSTRKCAWKNPCFMCVRVCTYVFIGFSKQGEER